MEVERRAFRLSKVDIHRRADGAADAPKITGHAAVFNKPTDMGYYVEEIAPGFFVNAIAKSDVRMLFNHDENFVMGRTKSGTLRIREDEVGLLTENDPPDTQTIRDLVLTPMERGDIDGMSFAFTVKTQQWTKMDNGTFKRRLVEAEELYDVSVVTFPAYPDTDVTAGKRSLELFQRENEEKKKEIPAPSLADIEAAAELEFNSRARDLFLLEAR